MHAGARPVCQERYRLEMTEFDKKARVGLLSQWCFGQELNTMPAAV
jgi:hypothetical protein